MIYDIVPDVDDDFDLTPDNEKYRKVSIALLTMEMGRSYSEDTITERMAELLCLMIRIRLKNTSLAVAGFADDLTTDAYKYVADIILKNGKLPRNTYSYIAQLINHSFRETIEDENKYRHRVK